MILVLERGTRPDERQAVLAALEELGLEGTLLETLEKPLVHVTKGPTRKVRELLSMDRVEAIVPTSGPRIRREGRHFYPYHFIDCCSLALAALGVLVALAGFFPAGVGHAFDPRRPVPELELPWYLRAPAALVDLLPGGFGWLLLVLAAGALLCLPYLDRSWPAPGQTRWPRWALLVLALVLWSLLTQRGTG